jgi:MSHA biogenesis protein MshP
MCPDRLHKTFSSLADRQRGFLLPVAMFIIVAMGLFALALWRTTAQTGVSAVQELMTLQTFYAAETGAQEGMSRLFYPDASSRQTVDDQCAAIDPVNRSYAGIPGLNNCSVVITCTCVDEGGAACHNPSASFSFYTITSVAECGSGSVRSVRTLQVSALMAQE